MLPCITNFPNLSLTARAFEQFLEWKNWATKQRCRMTTSKLNLEYSLTIPVVVNSNCESKGKRNVRIEVGRNDAVHVCLDRSRNTILILAKDSQVKLSLGPLEVSKTTAQ